MSTPQENQTKTDSDEKVSQLFQEQVNLFLNSLQKDPYFKLVLLLIFFVLQHSIIVNPHLS